MTPRWPHGDPREVARAVVSDPRFHTAPQGPAPKSLWDLLWEAVQEFFKRVFAPIGHLLGGDAITNVIGIVVLLVALAGCVLVIVRFAKRYRRVAGRTEPRVHAVALGEDADARTLRALALDAAAQGRYHDAAALLWLSALRALDELGRVRYDPARTPGEWRRLVRDPSFDALARDAVVALFAERDVDRELVERMRAAYDRVVPA